MCPLRRVSDQHAGPGALGILLPPGERTVLIVRPRSLPLDLLLVQGPAGTAFRELTKTEAAGVALGFLTALESWDRGGPGHVDAVSTGGGHVVWVDVGDFSLVACARSPGQPYRPLVLSEEREARQAAADALTILRPGSNEQEVYLNTRHFAR